MKTHARLQDALVPRLAVIKQMEQPPPDGMAEDLEITRQLRHFDVFGKRWYYFAPPSMEEHSLWSKSIRYHTDDTISISTDGMVDGLIARLKTKDGKPKFTDRAWLMRQSAEMVRALWTAIPAADEADLGSLVKTAEKK